MTFEFLIFTVFKSGFYSVLKIIFNRCRRQCLKNLNRRRRQRFKLFSDIGDSAKKYKTAIFKPKPSKF
jgi:hypothetical protein